MELSHHTKSKGDLGVLKAQVDLFEQGTNMPIECIAEGKGTQERSGKGR